MEKKNPYYIFSLGDSALTIDLGNRICTKLNHRVFAMQEWMLSHPFEGMKDVILGYSSLTILYDPFIIQKKSKITHSVFEYVKEQLEHAYSNTMDIIPPMSDQVEMPVCYDEQFGSDLSSIAHSKNLSIEEVIEIHLSRIYRVYMMGFLPGFAYMGEVDERIQVSRKHTPQAVVAGCVGIANGQTGIYPLDSPGGWQIVGRTPVKLFDANAEIPVRLKAGQSVRLRRISLAEFEELNANQ